MNGQDVTYQQFADIGLRIFLISRELGNIRQFERIPGVAWDASYPEQ
jgi:hypothetical protein